jgi:hypothetical protein
MDYCLGARMNVRQNVRYGPQRAPVSEPHVDLAREVEAKLGAPAWQVVRPAWREEHCDILAALAEVFDQIWAAVRSGASLAYRVVVRLEGMPEIVKVLTAEIAARSGAAYYRPPLPTLADHLRQVGVAVCAAADCHECASLGAVAERLGIAAPPEQLAVTSHELVQRLIGELNLPVFWVGRTMPALEDTFRLLVAPGRPTVLQSGKASPRPVPGSRLEATRELIRETRKLDTVTRPLTFGDAEG